MNRSRTLLAAGAVLLPVGLLTACGSSGDSADGTVELTLAHSYTEDQPAHECGAAVIKDEVEKADAGMSVEIYPASQLGGDADRIASVQSGDIDIDLQGASALAAIYEPVGVVDGAYVFDDAQHLTDFFASDAADQLKQDFQEASEGARVLGAWTIGPRHFHANEPIRKPADLKGLRVRFPGSPQFLMNAKALGANAVEVAFEEVYLGLQQGTVDAGENALSNIKANNFMEVQDVLSLSAHSENSNLIVVGKVYDELTEEQQQVLDGAVSAAVEKMEGCVEESDQAIVDEYVEAGEIEVVDDVDLDAFREQADGWFRDNLDAESLAVYEAIRNSAS